MWCRCESVRGGMYGVYINGLAFGVCVAEGRGKV